MACLKEIILVLSIHLTQVYPMMYWHSKAFSRALSYFISLFFLSACEYSEPTQMTWNEFYCRDNGDPAERMILYRAKVPFGWVRENSTESVQDSKRPICSFLLGEASDSVYLTIHTFIYTSFDQRIPPTAQIARWKRQFEDLDLSTLMIEPRAHGGFTGLSFYACGKFKAKETTVIGYAMQLAPQHWMTLQNDSKDSLKQKQMSADYTLKAIGSPLAVAKYKEEIDLFANSFELIDEVPTR